MEKTGEVDQPTKEQKDKTEFNSDKDEGDKTRLADADSAGKDTPTIANADSSACSSSSRTIRDMTKDSKHQRFPVRESLSPLLQAEGAEPSATAGAVVKMVEQENPLRSCKQAALASLNGGINISFCASDHRNNNKPPEFEEEPGEEAPTTSLAVHSPTFPVFLSYSRVKSEFAQTVRKSLVEHGFNAWIDTDYDCIRGGDHFYKNIDDGISGCKAFVACMSKEYLQSENCRAEMILAKERRKTIIPLLLEEMKPWPPNGELAAALAGVQYIKATGSLDEWRDALLKAVSANYENITQCNMSV